MVASLSAAGVWPLASPSPDWKDAFAWKSSPSMSICRRSDAPMPGPSAWYLSASGAQSAGAPNPGPEAATAAKAGPKAKSAGGTKEAVKKASKSKRAKKSRG